MTGSDTTQVLFDADPQAGTFFLEEVSPRVSRSELVALGDAAGGLSAIDLRRILDVAEQRRFPSSNLDEISWAFSQCAYEDLHGLSAWTRLFVSALCLYCDKRVEGGEMDLMSDSFYSVLAGEVEAGVSDCSSEMLRFLEWLTSVASPYDGYQDYYLLLSWLLLSRLRGDSEPAKYDLVMHALRAADWGELDLTTSERGSESWLELHRRIPLRYGYPSEDYEKMIRGIRP